MATFAKNLDGVKDAINSIPTSLTTTDQNPPEQLLPDLQTWLSENDCDTSSEKKVCYSKTRLMLIQKTYQLDNANDQLYAAKVVIDSLKNNLNTIINAQQQVSTGISLSIKK